MNIFHLFPALLSAGVTLLGIWYLVSLTQYGPHAQSDFVKMLKDGVATYSRRIFSNVVQILLYLIAVIFIFSYGFGKPFPALQLLATAIGGLSILAASLIQFFAIPPLLEQMVRRSNTYPNAAILAQFLGANGLSAIYMGIVGSTLYLSILFIGFKSIIGYGLGALLAGYFIRVGGGIFRAASSISNETAAIHDGKIPRFDPRNPGTYSEILGNIAGNILGVEADLVSSFLFAVTACVIFSSQSPANGSGVLVPIYIYSSAFVASVTAFVWCYFRIKFNRYSNVFLEGIYITVSLSAVATYFILSRIYGNGTPLFWCYITGLLGAIVIGFSSEVLTSFRFKYSRQIARHMENGSFHITLKALENSFLSNGLLFIFVAGIAVAAFYFSGPFGLAMASMGMLSVTQSILVGNFSIPISNAVSRLSGLITNSHIVHQNVTKTEQLAGTTVAIRNGFASGAALLSALGLITALIFSYQLNLSVSLFTDIRFLVPIFAGLTIPYVFLSFIMRGVQSATLEMTQEIQRQYLEIPFLRSGKAKPDVIRAVEQMGQRAMDSLVVPGILMLLPPIAIAYFGTANGILGLALGVFFSSFNCTFLWSNLGDSLQQARAYVETGHFGGNQIEKFDVLRSADHTGTVYRDVLSPGINMLLKAICMVTFLLIITT